MAPGEPLAGLLVSTTACFPLWCWLGDSAPSGVDLFQVTTDFLKNSMVIEVLPRGFGLYNWIPGSFSCCLSLEFALTLEARNVFI